MGTSFLHFPNNHTTSSLIMKIMGLFYLTLVCSVLYTSAAPAPTIVLPAAAAFSAAGGLVLTSAAGATLLTVPTNSILLAKALAIKGLLLREVLANQES